MPPDLCVVGPIDFTSAVVIDGAGIKSCTVTDMGVSDVTGTDSAVTRANDSAR